MMTAGVGFRSVPEEEFVTAEIRHSDFGGASPLSVRRTRCEAIPGVEMQYGGIDAHVVRLYLAATPSFEMSQGGQRIQLAARVSMESSIRDLRDPCTVRVTHPVDVITFELPRVAVAEWAHSAGMRRFAGLDPVSGQTAMDSVIGNIGLALLPGLAGSAGAPGLFVDYMLDALLAHLSDRFGSSVDHAAHGGLAPWQERRAKDLLEHAVENDLPLSRLAADCGISASHFVRAFHASTGTTPHRWLLERRVDRAKVLLRESDLPLAEVAVSCGFADQSHFTNTFSRIARTTPMTWRRMGRARGR